MKNKTAAFVLAALLGVLGAGCGSAPSSQVSGAAVCSALTSSSSPVSTRTVVSFPDTYHFDPPPSYPVYSDVVSSSSTGSQSNFNAEDYKSEDYKELARNPKKHIGDKVKFTGKVLQVVEDGNNMDLRVSVVKDDYGWDYNCVLYVVYTRAEDESRILEDDIIDVYGLMGDLYTYESTAGKQVSLPYMVASKINLKGSEE